MAGKATYPVPKAKDLLRDIVTHGSVSAYASSTGMDESTVRRWVRKLGITDRVRTALQKPVKTKAAPAAAKGRSTQHSYPPVETMISDCVKAGSVAAYARSLGLNAATVRDHLQGEGAMERVKEGLKAPKLQARPLPGDEITQEELLKAENAELRAAAGRDRKQEIYEERILLDVRNALATVPAPTRVGGAPAPRAPGSKEPHHRQLVALSDWHGGEIVDPMQVNGLNAYTWEIMEARVEELISGLLSHKANSPALTGLDIAFLGDMTSGHQHQELAETNEFPLAEQGVRMGQLMGSAVERLQPHYPDIRVVSIPGNHPRLKQKPAAKQVNDNFDWVSAMIAKEYLSKFTNIKMDVSTGGAMLHKIAGKTFYIWHGDGIKSTMPGVPWGGVMRRINDIRRGFAGTQIDCWLLGHFHQCNVMKSLGIYMNGCFVPGTRVTVDDGTRVPIEDVQEGQYVLTRTGSRPVRAVLPQHFDGSLVRFRTGPQASEIGCTPNHEIWAVKGAETGAVYPQGGTWGRGSNEPVPRWIAAENLSVRDFVEVGFNEAETPTTWDPGFYRLLGLYLAEGSVSGENGALSHIDFTHHIREVDIADFVRRECINRWGKATESERPNKTTRSVTVNSSAAAKEIVGLCGKGAHRKRLQMDLMTIDKNKQLEILLGWLQGDGHTNRNNGKEGVIVSGTTVSRALAEQMQQIGLRCGLAGSLTTLAAGPSRKSDSYTLLFTGDAGATLASLLLGIPDESTKDITKIVVDGRHFVRISHIWREPYDGPVYDLEVDTDHSYTVNGITVHNSLKGTDEWVIKNFGGGSDPEQLLLTFSEKRSRQTDARFLTPTAGLPVR